ncbi:MAG: hypothetical protein KAI47_17175, partial [Deltaproteobacteria bacterium]|nr:hypothetical protein [Deltaproteobacteria bacterium]
MRRTLRWLTQILVAAIMVSAASAVSAKRIVVLPFSGVNGGQAAGQVRRASGVKSVSAGSFRRARNRGGLTKAAKKLRVAAVITGKIKRRGMRWVLQIRIRNARNGQVVGRRTFSLRGSRLDGSTARQIGRAIRRYLRSCQVPAGASRVARRRPKRRHRPKRRRRH